MARATLLFDSKSVLADGAIIQMRIWLVPAPVRGSAHQLKYSLFYGRDGVRLVGYDNEAGKGDHRYYGAREEPYRFTTPERLMADFRADVARLRGEPI
ncbi:toxin-antitoxin system TumE family protein [Siccirubricoccus phaeus]|uniref:toxin-antitoxin system TumE family protein n=1 Tax=Siccirubricoccus phaeus TaxID=2595053 RepID=UPI0011F2D20E|nr:DUF6516 family protein [Siccirubricoccus phaeus]